jgi:hypothetical protein
VPDEGLWAYGVTAAGAAPSGLTGVAGGAVEPLEHDGLALLVSRVSLDEYGEEPLRRNLNDLAWLERTARAHHAVVDRLSRAGAVVPARLATVYRDDARLAQVISEQHDDLAGTLTRLTGRAEWGVKGYAASGARPRPEESASAGGGGAGGAGAAYLRRRRSELADREQRQRITAEAAAAVHAALAGYAVEARRHAAQDQRLSGAAAPMVLNGAYLIDRNGRSGFADLVSALADRYQQIRLELTGPWPPYSFVAEPGTDPQVLRDAA